MSVRVTDLINNHIETFLKFSLVGGAATVLNYSVFFILYDVINLFYLLSSAVGYVTGVAFGFYFNKVFTFESSDEYYEEGAAYVALYMVSLFLGLALLELLVSLGMPVLAANILVIGFTTVTNYTGSRYVVFGSIDWLELLDYYRYKYRHLITYITIGLGSLVVELLIITELDPVLPYRWPVIGLGFVAGMVFSYVLNAGYNFDAPENRTVRTFQIFAVISGFSFLLNIFLIEFVFQQFVGDLFAGLAGIQLIPFVQEYGIMRFASAATVFLLSYWFHVTFTFDTKEVGLAVYLSESESVRDIQSTVNGQPDFIHLDLVDETYNENADPVDIDVINDVKAIYPDTKRMLHIMSEDPLRWMEQLQDDVDSFIFHPEGDVAELITFCHENGVEAGLCISYDAEVDSFEQYLDDIDLVQILGIKRPGVSGQGMMSESLATVHRLQGLKQEGYDFEVCFDGGVKRSNVDEINADYVVSASAVLNAQNPKKALYDLKTNSRHYTDMEVDFRRHLKKGIESAITPLRFVTSCTLVGSFVEDGELAQISDVDIVVIVDELTEEKYDAVVDEFRTLGDQIETDYGYDIELNTTFGPLKFDDDDNLVLHVMIYDEERHRYHCQRSPFTCYAWQRSDTYFRQHLSEIGKVPTLQPNYFFDKRRSISDYLADLNGETVSYREYEFDDGTPRIARREKEMTDKDRFEFSYHIMKFSMTNFLKLYYQTNEHYDLEETIDRYFSVFPERAEDHIEYLLSLKEMKHDNDFREWKPSDEPAIRAFLEDFESQFTEFFENATSVYLVRHAETEANEDDTFLGQRRDPEIRDDPTLPDLPGEVDRLFTSPLKRSYQTASAIKEQQSLSELIVDDRLSEIDYGEADGLIYEDLEREYPRVTGQWSKDEDPRFPGGENTRDVLDRITDFLEEIQYDDDTVVVTHNVVIRCLLGSQYDVPMSEWHNIEVPHGEPLELLVAENGNRYINLTEEHEEACFRNITFRGQK